MQAIKKEYLYSFKSLYKNIGVTKEKIKQTDAVDLYSRHLRAEKTSNSIILENAAIAK